MPGDQMSLLTVQQFDDVLTDLLLDKIFLWFRTFKLNPSYRETNVSREILVDIVKRNVIQLNKLNDAVHELLQIPTVRETAKLTDETEKDFIQHAKRYFAMYLPTAGFEIAETDRYSGSMKREACIIATKEWHVGDEIRHCSGTLVSLTTEEERALEGGRDFSIMWSSRKDTMCLLLGPARFVNHDCCPNTEFISSGQNAIAFKFLRDVAIGEELTAYYGDNYFGAGNEECLCATCERNKTGSFRTEDDGVVLKEGLRPFVYDDKGKLIRRSVLRRKKSGLLTKSSKNKQLDKQTEKPLQPTTDIDCATGSVTQHTATTTISLPTRAEPMSFRTMISSARQYNNTNRLLNQNCSDNNMNHHLSSVNQEMESSWAGVNVVASPEIRVEWGITIFRRVNTPTHQGVNASLSNNFGVTGQSNSPFTPAGGSSRMSIAYLCSNDISDSSSKAIVIAGPSSAVNTQQEITRRCKICSEKYSSAFDYKERRCPRCTRHFNLFGIEWPLRKTPNQKVKAKDDNRSKSGKNRVEFMNSSRRMDKTAPSKGKNKQTTRPRNRNQQSLPEPEPSGEWEPFSTPGFIVNTIRYNGKDCIPSIAYEYNYQGETIRWDALTGFVHMNPIKKLMGNPNFKIEKLSCYQPSWNNDKFVIVGGNIKYQGTWFPYHNARKVIAEVLGLDNQGFVPIFGPGYRSNDRRPVIVVPRGHVLTDDSSESDDDVIMSDIEVEVRSC
ncbi:Histone-lysine N-methyltransferase SUV420H [Gigaspora margarita]|uniref:Histone-lysine N-methyltransferase SET9 n=2 Tax=Gigaspora TaxID=4873 RepID=A0A8H4AD11_GIGMA|nr:Histone-lysine N-methyltransferase SUV420H [Gigaspora margarita]